MDVDHIREAFEYDPANGELYWSVERPVHHFKTTRAYEVYITRFSGKRAGCQVSEGKTTYRQVRLNGVLYREHQLVWAIEYGDFQSMVDHFDGNGLNNKIGNLRLVDKVLNARNSSMKTNNTSGVTGVYWNKANQNWVAEGNWTENGIRRKKSLGSYAMLEDAKVAREVWMKSLGSFTDRHGK